MTQKRNIKQKLEQIQKEVSNTSLSTDRDFKSSSAWKDFPLLRYAVYTGVGVGVLWASKFLFSIMADNIRAFKDLTRSIQE